jgi:CHAT domain-containing protein
MNNTNPLSSYLALASSDQIHTGALQAKEIKDLKLAARLAVLAACNTANGRFADGEGLIGLTWALSAAGCPTTIASQWDVMDDSTEQLMTRLHQILRESNSLSTAEALRAAARQVRAQRPHPYYWAGFVVVGDGLRKG